MFPGASDGKRSSARAVVTVDAAAALYQRNAGLLLADRTLTAGPYQVIRWHEAALERTADDFDKVVRNRAAWYNLDQEQLTIRAFEMWSHASAWPKVVIAEVACRVADTAARESQTDSLERIQQIHTRSHLALRDLVARGRVGLGEQVAAELAEAHRLRIQGHSGRRVRNAPRRLTHHGAPAALIGRRPAPPK
jgi:hypothetical protein